MKATDKQVIEKLMIKNHFYLFIKKNTKLIVILLMFSILGGCVQFSGRIRIPVGPKDEGERVPIGTRRPKPKPANPLIDPGLSSSSPLSINDSITAQIGVGTNYSARWYKISVSRPSIIKANLSVDESQSVLLPIRSSRRYKIDSAYAIKKSVQLELMKNSYDSLAKDSGNALDYQITHEVYSGEYYFKISSSNKNVRIVYSFSVGLSPAPLKEFPITSAQTITSGEYFSGAVGWQNSTKSNWFKIWIPGKRIVKISLKADEMSDEIGLQITDRLGNVLERADTSNKKISKPISLKRQKGDLYIRVFALKDDNWSKFKLRATLENIDPGADFIKKKKKKDEFGIFLKFFEIYF